jgi:translation initiation factor IF-1
MGKNTLGGNKQKSKKNHAPKQKSVPINEITPDNKNKFIAKVTKTLGSYRVDVETYPTNDAHNALIPGSFRNRIWINTDDYVLIEISTELAGNNCYIVHKYDSKELEELVSLGKFVTKEKEDNEGINFQFGDGEDKDDFDINEI